MHKNSYTATTEPFLPNGAAAIELVWHRQDRVTSQHDDVRLEHLVRHLLDLDETDAMEVENLTVETVTSFSRDPASFYDVLQQAVREFRLFRLFSRAHDGEYHRSIRPAAYDERTGQHYPEEMARW